MNDFLSVIVPIHNVEATLTDQVGHLLEVVPDLSNRFEIILVDDGSTDHTVEIARELACEYPQLRFIRHADHRGVSTAIKTGSQWAQGRTLVVHESAATFGLGDLRRACSHGGADVPSAIKRTAAGSSMHGRADEAHWPLAPSRHVASFLNHLRNLTLGE